MLRELAARLRLRAIFEPTFRRRSQKRGVVLAGAGAVWRRLSPVDVNQRHGR